MNEMKRMHSGPLQFVLNPILIVSVVYKVHLSNCRRRNSRCQIIIRYVIEINRRQTCSQAERMCQTKRKRKQEKQTVSDITRKKAVSFLRSTILKFSRRWWQYASKPDCDWRMYIKNLTFFFLHSIRYAPSLLINTGARRLSFFLNLVLTYLLHVAYDAVSQKKKRKLKMYAFNRRTNVYLKWFEDEAVHFLPIKKEKYLNKANGKYAVNLKQTDVANCHTHFCILLLLHCD